MGSVFKLIADKALEATILGNCQHCEDSTRPAYDYEGIIVDPARAANPSLACEEPEISCACAKCIHAGDVRKDEFEISQLEVMIKRFASDPETAVEQYHRTPHIPLTIQQEDWPICCGNWCEYTGVPATEKESVLVPSRYRYWEFGPAESEFNSDNSLQLIPECLDEVCLFRCDQCKGLYFVWQFS